MAFEHIFSFLKRTFPKLLLLCVLLLVWDCRPSTNSESSITIIKDVTVISPDRPNEHKVQDVIIQGDRIVDIGINLSRKYHEPKLIISGKDKFLIPGLIDSHVHLSVVPGMNPAQVSQYKNLTDTYEKLLPKSYLFFGYTSVVDLNVIDRPFIDRLKNSSIKPDVYDCDGALVMANGYPMNFAPSPQRFEMNRNFLYDEKQKEQIPSKYRPEDHTVQAGVDRIRSVGGICIKSHFERGFGPVRNLPVLTPELAAQIRTLAHKHNLPWLLHANSYEAQKFGVDNGVDIIAHGLWNWGKFSDSKILPKEITDVLDQVIQNKIGYQATTQVLGGLQALFDPQFLNDPKLLSVLPADLLAWYHTKDGEWFVREMSEGEELNVVFQNFIQPLEKLHQIVKYLADRNADFLFGTDTPSSPTYANPPGYNGYLEMRRLHKFGLSLEQLFKAATISNAKAFHLEDQIGTIERGKKANLVLLDKNPLDSVEAYDSIDGVMIHGKFFKRNVFDARNNVPQKGGTF